MSSFLNYLGKGAAYGAATGGVMGLMDNDIGVAGGVGVGALFGTLAGAGGPAFRKLTNWGIQELQKSGKPIHKGILEMADQASMGSALHRGAAIGSIAGLGVGMVSDDTGVIGGKLGGAVVGAGLGFGRNKGFLSLAKVGMGSKKTSTKTSAVNAVGP